MGFFDTLKMIGKEAGKAVMDSANEMKELRIKFSSYPDERLVSIWRGDGMLGSSFAEKSAALAVLKERHGEEGTKEILRRMS